MPQKYVETCNYLLKKYVTIETCNYLLKKYANKFTGFTPLRLVLVYNHKSVN